jgi:hypothetical protein
MRILGIALIVVGVALLCAGLIAYRTSPKPEGEEARPEHGEDASGEQAKTPPEAEPG